ncbi:hypothetical protein Droror1_Dr00006426 [Drosera rotundifolia]
MGRLKKKGVRDITEEVVSSMVEKRFVDKVVATNSEKSKKDDGLKSGVPASKVDGLVKTTELRDGVTSVSGQTAATLEVEAFQRGTVHTPGNEFGKQSWADEVEASEKSRAKLHAQTLCDR